MRHGVASALLADGVTPAVVQRQLRHSDPRITQGISSALQLKTGPPASLNRGLKFSIVVKSALLLNANLSRVY
jgi:hypothetical protein